MNISRARSYALSVLAAAALLAGCNGNGGSQSSGLTPSSGVNRHHVLARREPFGRPTPAIQVTRSRACRGTATCTPISEVVDLAGRAESAADPLCV